MTESCGFWTKQQLNAAELSRVGRSVAGVEPFIVFFLVVMLMHLKHQLLYDWCHNYIKYNYLPLGTKVMHVHQTTRLRTNESLQANNEAEQYRRPCSCSLLQQDPSRTKRKHNKWRPKRFLGNQRWMTAKAGVRPWAAAWTVAAHTTLILLKLSIFLSLLSQIIEIQRSRWWTPLIWPTFLALCSGLYIFSVALVK